MTKLSIAVVGAGIVGMSAAIALRARGHDVTIYDRDEPCSQASTWNAGVLATSSLIPIANPAIFGELPAYLLGLYPGFSMNWSRGGALIGWGLRSLYASRAAAFGAKTRALNDLINFSRSCHVDFLRQAGLPDELVERGWLHLYWTPRRLEQARNGLGIYRSHGVAVEALSGADVRAMEPGLRRSPAGALFFPGTAAVRDPLHLAVAYTRLLVQMGGHIRRAEVRDIAIATDRGVRIGTEISTDCYDRVLVAAGPWSRGLLSPFVRLPIVVERGYLMQYEVPSGHGLSRPVFDTERGFVLSPRPEGIQLSTGTDLTTINAPPRLRQFTLAEACARDLVCLGDGRMSAPVVGNRPSTPDGMPIIGQLAASENILLATGHQHIGFSTGPGTGCLVADLIEGRSPSIDTSPFSPSRFGL